MSASRNLTSLNRAMHRPATPARRLVPVATLVALLSCLVPALPAQTGEPVTSPNRAQNLKKAAQDSIAWFAAKNPAQAEKALFAANRNKDGTAAWNLESAFALVQVATSLANRGDPESALDVAGRALHYLQVAGQKASQGEIGIAANAKELAGFVYEQFYGDPESAKQCYRDATSLAPNAGSSRERLDRLEKALAQASKKGHGS